VTGGGLINVITRSGTNRWSGAVHDSLRNDALDANSWTNKRVNRPQNVLRYRRLLRDDNSKGVQEMGAGTLPNTSALAGEFGRTTTARDPRIMQFGLRMSW